MINLDEQKFLQLYDEYVEKIYRYIFFRVGSQQLAQDLTSEVFLKSWQYINNSQKLENPRAFIYQVARNLIADTYRQKDQTPLSLEEISDNKISDKISDKNDGPAEKVDQSFEIEAIKNALINLNQDYQEIVIWRYLDELEIKEIALIVNKSEGAVRTLLCRALKELKNVLKKK